MITPVDAFNTSPVGSAGEDIAAFERYLARLDETDRTEPPPDDAKTLQDKVAKLRDTCPQIAITSDIIVGFPGETEEDFADTVALIETVGFDGLFAFKYSDRPNAPATRFAHKVNEADQNIRLQKVLELQENFTTDRNRALVGQTVEVLVESYRLKPGNAAGDNSPDGDAALTANTGQWTGRTSTNKIVHLPADGVTTELSGNIKEDY